MHWRNCLIIKNAALDFDTVRFIDKLFSYQQLHLTSMQSDVLTNFLIWRKLNNQIKRRNIKCQKTTLDFDAIECIDKLFECWETAFDFNAVKCTDKLFQKYQKLHLTLGLLNALTSYLLMTRTKRRKVMSIIKCFDSLTNNDAN